MAGWATLHISPMTILAVVSDVAYGSKTYLKELADDLKKQGIIAEDSTIDHVDDLLAAIATTAGTTASAFDTPPLSVEGLKATIEQTRQAASSMEVTKMLPQGEVKRLWNEIHETATNQGVDPLAISSAMTFFALDKATAVGRGALSTIRVTGSLFDRVIINHYQSALEEIHKKGYYATLAETSQPYIDALWLNFSSEKMTITEDLLSGKMIGQAWTAARRWLGIKNPPEQAD